MISSIRIYLILMISLKTFILCRPKQHSEHFKAAMGVQLKQKFPSFPSNLQSVEWINGRLNTFIRRKIRLRSSKSKRYLQVKDKVVNAKGDGKSTYGKLIIESVGYGLVRIKGVASNRYVCFNPINAKLRATKDGESLHCIFYENFNNGTMGTYFTAYDTNWYIAVKNNGRMKRGEKWSNKLNIARRNETFEFFEKVWR